MSHRPRWTLALAVLAILALPLAGPLVAQAPGAGPGAPGGRAAAPGPHADAAPDGVRAARFVRRMAAWLDLTEEQRATARALREDTRVRLEPVREEVRELRRELRALLDGPAPDPQTVGAVVLALEAQREEMRQIREEGREAFEALLTAQQLERFEEAIEVLRFFRGPRRGGAGEGGAGPA